MIDKDQDALGESPFDMEPDHAYDFMTEEKAKAPGATVAPVRSFGPRLRLNPEKLQRLKAAGVVIASFGCLMGVLYWGYLQWAGVRLWRNGGSQLVQKEERGDGSSAPPVVEVPPPMVASAPEKVALSETSPALDKDKVGQAAPDTQEVVVELQQRLQQEQIDFDVEKSRWKQQLEQLQKEKELADAKSLHQPAVASPLGPERSSGQPSDEVSSGATGSGGTLQAFVDRQQVQQQQTLMQISALASNLENMAQNWQATQQQIERLEGSLSNLGRAVSKIGDEIGLVDNRVLSLNSTLNAVSADLGNLKRSFNEDVIDWNGMGSAAVPSSSKKPGVGGLPAASTGPEYVVHAIVPGRAWLKSNTGQITSVTEGETLGGYGKVVLIDAQNYVVLTSSGVHFK